MTKPFKTQMELHEALLRGETIRQISADPLFCRYQDGQLMNGNSAGGEMTHARLLLCFPDTWAIYKEPVWSDSIPPAGRLCWVSDMNEFPSRDEGCRATVVTRHNQGTSQTHNYIANAGGPWKFATPLTYEEVRAFLPPEPQAQEGSS